MSSPEDWGRGGKGDNACETINTGPLLPPKINSLLKIKEKKFFGSVFLLKKMRIMPQ